MMTAEPDYRWDGDRWWRWSQGRWAPVSAADPQPRLVDLRLAADHAEVDLVSSWMRYRGGTKRALRALPAVLGVEERVEFILAADHDGHPGLLVLTSARLLFLSNARSPALEFSSDVGAVVGAAAAAGGRRRPVTVQLREAVVEFVCVDGAAAAALAGLLTLRSTGQLLTTAAPGGPVIAGQDAVAALSDLTRMFELGLVTSDEFETKRTEILKRL